MNGDRVSPNSQPPIFTTSHRSPLPLSATIYTNWADHWKMCVAKRMCWGGGHMAGGHWPETSATRGWWVTFFMTDIQMLGREREIIKARTSVSIPVKGIWMRAYPIIGCLHLSCYPWGQSYPTEHGEDFNKPHISSREGAGWRGGAVCVVGLVGCRSCLHFQKALTGRQVHHIGRFTFQSHSRI